MEKTQITNTGNEIRDIITEPEAITFDNLEEMEQYVENRTLPRVGRIMDLPKCRHLNRGKLRACYIICQKELCTDN